MGFLGILRYYTRLIILVLTPLLLLPLPLVIGTKESECAYIVLVVAIFWLSEALPLAITGLLPALLFPLFGIIKSKDVANSYFRDFHLLLVGVICLATSIEKWNLHRRIALRLVMMLGVNSGRLMMGFMLSCAFLSMWLSNTSTAAMVMPIVEAVTQQIVNAETEAEAWQENGVSNSGFELNEKEDKRKNEEGREGQEQKKNDQAEKDPPDGKELDTVKQERQDLENCCNNVDVHRIEPEEAAKQKVTKYKNKEDHKLCKAMCLCVAYSSTIGGLSTITGTSTNLIFIEQFNTRYPESNDVNFGSWFVLVFPMSIIILILSWVWLHIMFCGFNFKRTLTCNKTMSDKENAAMKVIQNEYKKLGAMGYQEIITLILFCLMAGLWFTREPGFFPGWASLFPESYDGYATDSSVALLVGLLFFILPAGKATSSPTKKKGYNALITWSEFNEHVPWDIFLLVGGGFALAEGCELSGLSLWVGSKLEPLKSLPVLVIILISCLLVTTVTEVASNPATITIFLPILAPLAEAIHVNPLYLLIPTTLCTSFAFLLPVSNPPNAIVFGYGHVTMMDMVKAGLGVNIIGVAVVMIGISTWAVPLFSLDVYPSWAPDLRNITTTP